MLIMLLLMWWYALFFLVHPCGNFSDTSSVKFQRTKGSIGPVQSLTFQTGPDYILCITARTRPYWLGSVVMRNADRHLVCELHPWVGASRHTPPLGLGCGLNISAQKNRRHLLLLLRSPRSLPRPRRNENGKSARLKHSFLLSDCASWTKALVTSRQFDGLAEAHNQKVSKNQSMTERNRCIARHACICGQVPACQPSAHVAGDQ